MIDIKKIIQDKSNIERELSKKMGSCSFDELLLKEEQRKKKQQQLEELQRLRNIASKEISFNKSKGIPSNELISKNIELGNQINICMQELADIREEIQRVMEALPNIPDKDIADGGKENNEVLYQHLEQPSFDFDEKDHIELEKDHDLIDYERGVKISGKGSWVYKNDGALLEWALLNYCINEHIKDGWEFVLLPHMLNYNCGYVAGQFPKFQDEVYWIDSKNEKNGKFLLPTAETALVNLHKNEILEKSDLPKKYFSYTPCYRREAGSSRKEERGTIRGHQFNKVELVQLTLPEESDLAFQEMLSKAEKLVKDLGLHYQVSKLAAGDCSAAASRTYDIEIWIPSMKIYKEISSVSNCRDYQAIRGNIKYRGDNGKPEYINTLNGSGLATSRLFPALIEQCQQKDGSIVIPEVLRGYMQNKEVIEPSKIKQKLRRK